MAAATRPAIQLHPAVMAAVRAKVMDKAKAKAPETVMARDKAAAQAMVKVKDSMPQNTVKVRTMAMAMNKQQQAVSRLPVLRVMSKWHITP